MPEIATLRILAQAERVVELAVPGVTAWTTTALNGSFGLGGDETAAAVMHRWDQLQADLVLLSGTRLATAAQIHGNVVSTHEGGWHGWLRQRGVDGHVTGVRGTALAVTVADCTPVFIAHEHGVAMLHAGWRGTAAQIMAAGFNALAAIGCPADECSVHLGPSICAGCYEVGPEVIEAITGKPATGKAKIDVRNVLAEQAMALGVKTVSTSSWCTRCGGGKFFSHRAGDIGRQLGIILLS